MGWGKLLVVCGITKKVLIVAATITIDYLNFQYGAAAKLALCSDEFYAQKIEDLFFYHLLTVDDCSDTDLKTNPLYCQIVYGHSCDQTHTSYPPNLAFRYQDLFERINECINAYNENFDVCKNQLMKILLEFYAKKNN